MYFVVGEKDLDDADMILSAREFFMLSPQQRSTAEFALRPHCIYIPEQTSVVLALRTLKAHNEFAALISDEYGGISGLISRSRIYAALTAVPSAGSVPLPRNRCGRMRTENSGSTRGLTRWKRHRGHRMVARGGAQILHIERRLLRTLRRIAESGGGGDGQRNPDPGAGNDGNRASKLEVTLLQDPERKTGMEEKEESHSC